MPAVFMLRPRYELYSMIDRTFGGHIDIPILELLLIFARTYHVALFTPVVYHGEGVFVHFSINSAAILFR